MKKQLLTVLIFHCLIQFTNAQWAIVNDYIHNPVTAFADNGNYLYAAVAGDGLYKTSNLGNNWILSDNGISNLTIKNISVRDSFVFLVSNSGVYRSTNYGNNWANILNGSYVSITFVDTLLFVGSLNGIFRSSNYGGNWELIYNGIPNNNSMVTSFAVSNNYLYACIDSLARIRIYRTSNLGNNWLLAGQITQNGNVYSLYAVENFVLCGTSNGVYKSTNYGTNWILIPGIPGNIGLFGFASIGTKNIFISAWGYGVYVSNDYGQTWTQKNDGLLSLCSTALFKFENYIFLGTNWNSVIYRRPISEVITIKQINSIIPENYKLLKNYPNPFNPTTNIKYQIADNKYITLKVYNILGKEIETLVNEKQSPGTYEVSFDGSRLSSGIYFYRIQAGDFMQVKKMVLIK